MKKTDCPRIGDIYRAELPFQEYIQSGIRPVIIAQNDTGNMFSPTIHVIPLTAQIRKAGAQPTHVTILADNENGLSKDSVALVEDMHPVPFECLRKRIGRVDEYDILNLKSAFKIQFPFAG